MNLGIFRKQATAKFMRADSPGALINVAPPSTTILFIVMALTVVVLGLLVFVGQVQLVAEGRGVIRPDEPSIVLHAPFNGTVLAVQAARRDTRHAGDVLVTMDVQRELAGQEKCGASLASEQRDLAQLEQRLADWNEAEAHGRDASMALVLIAQIRAQREKVNATAQRCETLATVIERSRVVFPVDAVIADVAVTSGAQVHEGDMLATLVPSSARLVGYIALPEARRSELGVGQAVRLRFDALPSERIGAGSAHVVRLLEALPSGVKIDSPDGAGVFAEVAIDSMPATSGPPRAGMTFTADVMTTKTRLASLLFGED